MLRRSFVSKDRSSGSSQTTSSPKTAYASTKRSSRSSRLTKRSSRSSLSFRSDDAKVKLIEQFATATSPPATIASSSLASPALSLPGLVSDVIAVSVGKHGKLFAAHVDNLVRTQFFFDKYEAVKDQPLQSRRIYLPEEDPDIFTAVLEYLYRGDYRPRLVHTPDRRSWYLEDVQTTPLSPNSTANRGDADSVLVHLEGTGWILRETAIYCAADRFGLDELKLLALRKQNLQSGMDIDTILRSARYAYNHTPPNDSRLRAHFLTLIIKNRRTFANSGTMQDDMESGGTMHFDLFVAMCRHIDDKQQEIDALKAALIRSEKARSKLEAERVQLAQFSPRLI